MLIKTTKLFINIINPFSTIANSTYQDGAFDQGLLCLLRPKRSSIKDIHGSFCENISRGLSIYAIGHFMVLNSVNIPGDP